MKLRTRFFFSSSALMVLALIGLLLGIFSVIFLTKAQNQLMSRNLQIIEATGGMRQEMGTQVVMMLRNNPDPVQMEASDQRFRQWLSLAGEDAVNAADRQELAEIESAYEQFDDFINKRLEVHRNTLNDDHFALNLQPLRDRLAALQQRYVRAIEHNQESSRQRAWLVASLLSAIGVALLLIGFVTANSIARRFGQPIETLTSAAEQIGRGDYHVNLPVPQQTELAILTRRFGQMAEALRQFHASNVAALIAGQRRLQAVLDSITDGLLIIDRDGRLEHGNPVAQSLLGWAELPLGEPLQQLLAQPTLEARLALALTGQPTEQASEDLCIDSYGEQRLLSNSLTPVSDENGVIIGAVMVLRDVTELRAFERIRSEFVLRASHELRTPVTGMHMAFGLLRERLHFPELSREEDLLQTLGSEMQRLLHLLDGLLDFSRYQSGLQELDLKQCDPAELIVQAAERFTHKATARQISLQVNAQQGLPLVCLDRVQLERVLDNLLGNALRHSQDGGQIRLQAHSQDERVFISVEDQGEGIAYSQQARIFEPFVQVGRRKGGAGLGLALCKEIIQLHGGHIRVNSSPGMGARFYLELPIQASTQGSV